MISAAQLFTYLSANCLQRKPDHESQLRPLVGLAPEQAKSAWEHAVQKAGNRRITARMVKSAMQELKLAGQAAPVAQKQGPTKAEKRQLIDDAFGQLLLLLSQKVAHALLTEKVEALHGHIQALFSTSDRKK